MPGRRIDLQPPFLASGSSGSQDPRFAVRIPGGARSGIAFVNVLELGSAGAINIFTAHENEFTPYLGTANDVWVAAGATPALLTARKTVTIALTQLGEWVRWGVTTIITGTPSFSIVLFVYDA